MQMSAYAHIQTYIHTYTYTYTHAFMPHAIHRPHSVVFQQIFTVIVVFVVFSCGILLFFPFLSFCLKVCFYVLDEYFELDLFALYTMIVANVFNIGVYVNVCVISRWQRAKG